MPVALQMRRVGRVLVPARREDDVVVATLPENAVIKVSAQKKRRRRRHDTFFRVIDRAFELWPEGHEPEPDSSEMLRAWLLCKAGCHLPRIDYPMEASTALAVDLERRRQRGVYAFVKPIHTRQGDVLAVYEPRSIAWDEMDEAAFGPVCADVFDICAAVIGVPVDALINQEEAA